MSSEAANILPYISYIFLSSTVHAQTLKWAYQSIGFAIYHFIQPTSNTNTFSNFPREFGGEHGFRDQGFNLTGGLFGITGNLILIAIITFVVVSIQKIFSHKAEPPKAQ